MDLNIWSYVAAIVGGGLIALLLTVFGGGGSVLATPLLLYVVGIRDPHVAIGTSAAAVAVNAAAGLGAQARAGRVKWPCASVFAGAGLAGSFVGASLATHVDGQRLMLWFSAAMAAVAVAMLMPKKADGDPAVRLDIVLAAKLTPAGLVTGLAAGFFGIGGGFLIVPGLMAATGMTLANAAASSLVSVVVFGAATSASYAVSGFVNWSIFAALVFGGLGGTLAGLPVARRLASHATGARRIFAVMVLATAAYVAVRSIQ